MARDDDAGADTRRSSGIRCTVKTVIVCCSILAALLSLEACATTSSVANQPTATIVPTATPVPAFTQLDSMSQLLLSDPSTLTHQQVLNRNTYIDNLQNIDIAQIVRLIGPNSTSGGNFQVGSHPTIGGIVAETSIVGANVAVVIYVDCGVITTNTGQSFLVLASPQNATNLHGKWEATLVIPGARVSVETTTLGYGGLLGTNLLQLFPRQLNHPVLFIYQTQPFVTAPHGITQAQINENKAYLSWVSNRANAKPSYVIDGNALKDPGVLSAIGGTAEPATVEFYLCPTKSCS